MIQSGETIVNLKHKLPKKGFPPIEKSCSSSFLPSGRKIRNSSLNTYFRLATEESADRETGNDRVNICFQRSFLFSIEIE